MSDKRNYLGKYKGKELPPLEKREAAIPQLVKEPSEYQAVVEFIKGRKSARFRVVDADGKSYGCSYPHLLDWVYEPPTLLTITTATRIFTFRGKNLKRIEELLLEDGIKEFHVFTERLYKAPAENKPIIEELTIDEQT